MQAMRCAAIQLAAALISGAVSGLAATGTNQVFKQLMKAAENGEDITKIDITKPQDGDSDDKSKE